MDDKTTDTSTKTPPETEAQVSPWRQLCYDKTVAILDLATKMMRLTVLQSRALREYLANAYADGYSHGPTHDGPASEERRKEGDMEKTLEQRMAQAFEEITGAEASMPLIQVLAAIVVETETEIDDEKLGEVTSLMCRAYEAGRES